ncbi:MAG: DUF3089 domain-containing protein, partial [Actinomycetota bacterium]|nr:DUF3089 domain-containing protein [Actinomycetota bacterium]
TGAVAPIPQAPVGGSGFDCFYVYPTVSPEPSDNADLRVQPAEAKVAREQASRFSSVCDVWAPMYRQVTLNGLVKTIAGHDRGAAALAYRSLLAGWKDFLVHHDDRKPIILIGHSQGAAILIQLVRRQFDPDPGLRKRLVSAIIVGGNVQVPAGKTVGGSFRTVPICTSGAQAGCVIAYSSFGTHPPSDALFARPGQGISLQAGQTASAGQQVACTNPADLGGGPGPLQPFFASTDFATPAAPVTTPWVSFPELYSATCAYDDGASWLQVNGTKTPDDPRPLVADTLGPAWGYHAEDVNIALGNLVSDVAAQEHAYR